MVCVFLAPGFEEIEALTAVDILRRAGAKLVTAGIGGRQITGAHNVTVLADTDDSSIDGKDLEMVVLPGGPGTGNIEKSPHALKMIDYALKENIPVGAICAAPTVLGHMGALKGRKAVCYPGCEAELRGAVIAADSVCEDGNIITGNGPGASTAFALRLVKKLKGADTARRVAEAMQVRENYV
jgi:protein deglycase